MASFIFLFGLFYLRFIPISIFWIMFSLFSGKNRTISSVLFIISIILSYTVAFFILISLPVAILNYFFQGNVENSLVPMLLFVSENNFKFLDKTEWRDSLFSLLLNKTLCSKKKVLALRTILTAVQVMALVLIIIGGIEVFNDYNSHSNPDIFDFLFPENGAGMFWGGIAMLTFIHFFLNFLTPTASVIKWKRRFIASANIPRLLRDYVISPSFIHPYFFLSPQGRGIVRREKISSIELILLLKKSFIENKDIIPDEWIEKLAKNMAQTRFRG